MAVELRKSVPATDVAPNTDLQNNRFSPADSALGELPNEVHRNTTICCARISAGGNLAVPANATTLKRYGSSPIVIAQAIIPRDGMMDAQNPMPMKERYLRRFPQPARVGHLIGMPVLDLYSKTLGYVREVVRTPARETEFIVSYSQWWGWFGRPVAVPLDALGIEGGHLVSLDMSPSEFAAAPTWHDTGATPLPADATVRVALSRS
jgi:hypothetical protein